MPQPQCGMERADRELEAIVERIIVDNEDDARRLGFLGSPTLKINGVDVEPSARQRTDFGMACRVYRLGGRVLGAPPREMIQQALASLQHRSGLSNTI